jgi:hypothetical protein
MPNEQAILEVAGLTADGVALSEALLGGDLTEARFRAHLIARRASAPHLCDVQEAAMHVVRLLGAPDKQPNKGYALAVMELSGALDQALAATAMRSGECSRQGERGMPEWSTGSPISRQ